MNPATGAFADAARKMMALPRYAQASEIVDFVAYLASPAAGFITGADLRIDAGRDARRGAGCRRSLQDYTKFISVLSGKALNYFLYNRNINCIHGPVL
jgi:hypothetical protein